MEVEGGKVGDGCQSFEVEGLVEMAIDVFEHVMHAPRVLRSEISMRRCVEPKLHHLYIDPAMILSTM